VDLEALLRDRCRVQRPEDLAVRQASSLIDEIRSMADAGEGWSLLVLSVGFEKRRRNMGAKRKLNEANILLCVLVAGLIGGLTQSWLLFVLVFVVLLAAAYHGGSIRR